MTRSITIFLVLMFSAQVFGYEDGVVEIIQVSSSGRTIYLNRGAVDGIKNEEYGVLMLKEEISLGKFAYKPVAKIRSVKTLGNESVWIGYKVFIPSKLIAGQKLTLLSESNTLTGKNDLAIKRKKLVVKDNPVKEVKDFLLEGDSLAKKESNYKVLDITKKREKHTNKDVELLDVNQFENTYGDGRLFISGIYKSPYAEEFNDRKRVHAFEKMVVAYFRKFNDPTYNAQAYVDNYESDRSGTSNTYKVSAANDLENYRKRKKLFKKLRKKGARWSKDYTDSELSNILEAIETDYEVERRRNILAYRFKYQAYASFGLNLINNENVNDPETTEQSKYDLEFGAESYFFKRFNELKILTVEFSGRIARDAFYGGELNARSTELSGAIGINWYPFRRPSAIEANILYVGALFRYGFSFLTNITNDERGNYQVFSFPGFRAGYKYNFSSKFGVRATAGFEEIRAERLVRDNDIGTLPDRVRYYDGRMSFGISRFF